MEPALYSDADPLPDQCDSCPLVNNFNQVDTDGDGSGNGCDLDDDDDDGLLDVYETETGIYISEFDTGSHPLPADTDRDGADDGAEVAMGSDPNFRAVASLRGWGLVAYAIMLAMIGGTAAIGRFRTT